MVGSRRVLRGAAATAIATSTAIAVVTGCFGRTPLDDFGSGTGFSPDGGFGGSPSGATGGRGGASTGGQAGRAGNAGTGGSFGAGGFLGAGGAVGMGGAFTGGLAGASGAFTGGFAGAGGGASTGGRLETGGSGASGGVVGAGGRSGTGGVTGTGGAAPCPVSCGGCCDATGACLSGLETNACGLGGVRCIDCGSSGFACDNGTCHGAPPACGVANCKGCCDSLGRCRSGDQVDACGLGGGQCSNCGAKNENCQAGACFGRPPACDLSSCGGCCDASGVCHTGTVDTACGANGALCDDCSANGRKCNEPGSYCAFIPSCSALTCPSGCCDASGVCRDGRTDAACGTSGNACTDCGASGEHCSAGGFCYNGAHCGPDNCNGCCTSNGGCLGGTGSRNCGSFGTECDNCTGRNETCQGGACGAPGATCPAPYPGCTPGLATSPPVQGTSCAQADLSGLVTACPDTASSPTCSAAVLSLSQSNPGCFDCVQQFLYDGAVVKCLAPFLSSSCNQALSCATECVNESCGQCSAADSATCRSQAFQSGGACASYITGYFCAQAAFSGPAAFCDIKTIGSIGGFLQGVGAYYCSR